GIQRAAEPDLGDGVDGHDHADEGTVRLRTRRLAEGFEGRRGPPSLRQPPAVLAVGQGASPGSVSKATPRAPDDGRDSLGCQQAPRPTDGTHRPGHTAPAAPSGATLTARP